MKTNQLKLIAITILFMSVFTVRAEMHKDDVAAACSAITIKTHSHFNLVHNNNVDKFAMEEDFKLDFNERVLVIHNGLNEIHISYLAIKYISVGKPDKAHSELKGQWFIMF